MGKTEEADVYILGDIVWKLVVAQTAAAPGAFTTAEDSLSIEDAVWRVFYRAYEAATHRGVIGGNEPAPDVMRVLLEGYGGLIRLHLSPGGILQASCSII